MKRLIVYSIYDHDGYIDGYIPRMLISLRGLAETIVVISNVKLINKETIAQHADAIYERSNIGFDCGAYKDALIKYIGDEIKLYDQIVLMNDTFYGPFFSWEEVFFRMENEECDCWALTQKANNFKDDKTGIVSKYLQTYFICFNKRIICDENFYNFWKEIKYPLTLREDMLIFEIGINKWLINNDYISMSYLDVCNGEKYTNDRLNPYGDFISEIISECRFPIIKRHAISILYWGNMMRAIKYVEEYTDYDVSLIWENWRRYFFKNNRNEPNIVEFKRFCDKHKDLYVYGNGLIGKRVMLTLKTMGYLDAEYFVTHRKGNEKVKEIQEIVFDNESGIIIAVDEILQDELINEARKYVNGEQIITVTPQRAQ